MKNNPAEAVEGCDIILFVVPAFVHEKYLRVISSYIEPGTILVGLPGNAGFEFAIREILGNLAKQCTIMSFESLPWVCRVTDIGKRAEVFGTKKTLFGAVHFGSTQSPSDPIAMVQSLVGKAPKLTIGGHLLGLSLMGTNGYLHPSIMYGKWKKYNGEILNESPLFYSGIDDFSASVLSAVSNEVLAIARSIVQQKPQVKLVLARGHRTVPFTPLAKSSGILRA